MQTTTRATDAAPGGSRPAEGYGQPGDGQLPDAPRGDTDWSLRRAAATAGIGLMLMIIPAFFGNFVAIEGLVTPGDAARTTADISASLGLFRLGVASLFAVVLLDVVVAVALYRVFRPVSVGASTLAASARLVYGAIFMVAISNLAGVANLLDSPETLAVLDPEQLQAQVWLGIESFLDTWSAGLLVFGLHLLAISWLTWRSDDGCTAPGRWRRARPRVLAALLALAGVGYAFDSMAGVVVGQGAPTIAEFTFLGEVVLAFWLIAWSRRLGRDQTDRQGAHA